MNNIDNYTTNELLRASKWFISEKSTSHKLYLGCCDRAMLLLACCTAFRGDSVCPVLMSDLFTQQILLPALGSSASLLVSILGFVCFHSLNCLVSYYFGWSIQNKCYRPLQWDRCYLSLQARTLCNWGHRYSPLGLFPPSQALDSQFRSWSQFAWHWTIWQ